MAGAIIEIKYFNTFLLKKTNSNNEPIWNGSFGIPPTIGGYPAVGGSLNDTNSWVYFIEIIESLVIIFFSSLFIYYYASK